MEVLGDNQESQQDIGRSELNRYSNTTLIGKISHEFKLLRYNFPIQGLNE